MSEPCNVCFEKYNKSTRKVIECQYCNNKSCVDCIKKYFLTTRQEPHCMRCKTAWNRDFWMDIFPRTFISKDLKKHREDVLFDREKSLLPNTQPAVERILEGKRREALCGELQAKINALRIQLYAIPYGDYSQAIHDQKKAIQMQISELNFEYEWNRFYQAPAKQPTQERKQFVRACPANGCRGFLSTQWKCGICEMYTCSECGEVIGKERHDANHKCKPENVATEKLLAKDTKPCPKCGSMIFRISGCSQIWCTRCNIGFDWNTAQIIDNNHLHNPHYFEYLRQVNNGQAPQNQRLLQGQCDDLPTYWTFRNFINSIKIPATVKDECNTLFESIRHNEQVVMPRYQRGNVVNDNEDLRIKFLMNEITEEKFKYTIQVREKALAKKTEIYRIMQMFNTISKDMIVRLVGTKNPKDFLEIWKEFAPLKEYVKDSLEKVSKRYNCSPPYLMDNLEWSR